MPVRKEIPRPIDKGKGKEKDVRAGQSVVKKVVKKAHYSGTFAVKSKSELARLSC